MVMASWVYAILAYAGMLMCVSPIAGFLYILFSRVSIYLVVVLFAALIFIAGLALTIVWINIKAGILVIDALFGGLSFFLAVLLIIIFIFCGGS